MTNNTRVTVNDVERELKGLPCMSKTQAEIIKSIFIEHKIKNALELGFYHGLSTCYMASIFDELGWDGKITTIDRLCARELTPNIEHNLKKLNLEKYVEIIYEYRSYTWRLMKFLEESPRRQFDFCYFDGGHILDPTGFAFFLADKLLKPGGIIIFDDLKWNITNAVKNDPSRKGKYDNFSKEEQDTAQIGKVYEFLVKEHENYHNFKLMYNNSWGFAQKK